jgi:hypothetical protein
MEKPQNINKDFLWQCGEWAAWIAPMLPMCNCENYSNASVHAWTEMPPSPDQALQIQAVGSDFVFIVVVHLLEEDTKACASVILIGCRLF